MLNRVRGHLLQAAAALLLLSLGTQAFAQVCLEEVEPNDTPAQALRFSEATCLTGVLEGRDQDAFMWQVGEEQAGRTWTFELEGHSGGDITRFDLMGITFHEDGQLVAAAEDLLHLQAVAPQNASVGPLIITPGDYFLGFSKSGGDGRWVFHMREGAEIGSLRRRIDPGSVEEGEVALWGAAHESLSFSWQLDEEDILNLWNLELTASFLADARLILTAPDGSEVRRVQASPAGRASTGGLGLEAGTYEVTIESRAQPAPFQLDLSRAGRIVEGMEVEPNNSFTDANVLRLDAPMRGMAGDLDYFIFSVGADEAGAAWELVVASEVDVQVALYNADREALFDRQTREGRFGDLEFSEGDYYLLVYGRLEGAYEVTLQRSATLAAEGNEAEPNDFPASATPLPEDLTMRGTLAGRETDVFSFDVIGAPQLWRIQAIGEGVRQLRLLNGGAVEEQKVVGERRLRIDNVRLLPGRNYVEVSGEGGEYALRAIPLGAAPEEGAHSVAPSGQDNGADAAGSRSRAQLDEEAADLRDPPPGLLELEPNDDNSRADRLRVGQTRVGNLATETDRDRYRFFLPDPAYVRISSSVPDGAQLRLAVDGAQATNIDGNAGESTAIDYLLPAGDHFLEVRAQQWAPGYYTLDLETFDGLSVPRDFAPLGDPGWAPTGAVGLAGFAGEGVAVELASPYDEVAAYWHDGQVVPVQVTVRGDDRERTLKLYAATNTPYVRASVPEEVITLGPGEERQLTVQLEVLPDLRDDQPLQLTVAAATEGEMSSAGLALQPRCEARPVLPQPMWSTPEPLMGGINLLWRSFGVEVTAGDGRHVDELFDGTTAPSTGYMGAPGDSVTVRLPGGEAQEIAGLILEPQSRGGFADRLREFRLELSPDGENFHTVLESQLGSGIAQQGFALPEPERASHARLTVLSNFGGRNDRIYLGEWKLVSANPAPFGQHNIAHPDLGGHVSWSSLPLLDRGAPLLLGDSEQRTVSIRDAEEMQWVVGFHHARAARIDRLVWHVAGGDHRGMEARHVTIEASMQGPAGPWSELASREISAGKGGQEVFELPEQPWVRYLRFTVPLDTAEHEYMPPAQIEVIEREAGGDYLSIVGEWDQYRRDAYFELTSGAAKQVLLAENDDNDTMEHAQHLASGDTVQGTVEVAYDEDWFRVRVPEGENLLTVELTGDPTIAYLYELYDAQGEPVFYDVLEGGEGVTLQAYAEPGDYFLHLWEPRRSVVFSWDTSGSVAPFQPITYSSLAGFASGLDPRREITQLLAFDNPEPQWLLSHWSDDPLQVQMSINQFDRRAASSNSELALLTATEGLADREGTRAILFMTDAETDGYRLTPELWEALQEVRPRVFTFEISSAGSGWTQDLMQDWASVNGGFYDYARSIGDFDIGFARASCHLRRPKGYTLSYETAFREPPGPGQLSVERAGDLTLPAVQVIFDASGSMGSRLEGGEQKIEIAKAVLAQLATEILPEGVPFALRAFGHVTPNSCEMKLEVPLAPLDRQAARQAIAGIQPKLLSQTPLAGALLAVPDDLGAAASGSTVILITDGEESCGGDPGEAMDQLRSQGVDLRLSIVSLGIDDGEVREQFADLAAAAGGEYVDARDAQTLRASIEAALYPTFRVLDSTGEQLIATGRVDMGPIELPMGVYLVTVDGFPGQHTVRVPGDDLATLRVQ